MLTILFYCISFFFPVSPVVLLHLFKKKEKTLSQKILFMVFLLQTFFWIVVIAESTNSEIKDIFIVVFILIFLNSIFYFLSRLVEKNEYKKRHKNEVLKEEHKLNNDTNIFENENKIKKIRKKKILLVIGGVILFSGIMNFFYTPTEKDKKIETNIIEETKNEKQNLIPYTFEIEQNIQGIKLQGNVFLDFTNGRLPNIDEMRLISEDISEYYPNFENYFINFKFPFTDISEKRNEEIFDSYYLFNKTGNSDFLPITHHNLIPELKITLNKKVINHLGINLITNIAPITEGMSLAEVKQKLGEPSIVSENKEIKEIEYYVVNEKYQVLGMLFIHHENNLVKSAKFFSLRLNFTKKQLADIDSYIAGNKKFSDLNIKELKDIY
nr:hypothetical protein [Fusobacterium necrophorum]